MCGGSGNRLWPLSRHHYPKQFARLFAQAGRETLFRCAMDRAARCAEPEHKQRIIVVCNHAHRFFVADGLRETERAACTVLVEPQQRNTAAAATLAALDARREFGDALLLLMPSDHRIADENGLARAVAAARPAAQDNQIVVFGIPPTHAETQYGYIHIDAAAAADTAANPACKVLEFCEKPDQQTAAEWLARGHCYWNSGLFLVKASVYLQAIAAFEPDIAHCCEQAYAKRVDDLGFTYAHAESFAQCRNISMDYAIMERADNLRLVPLPTDLGWSDLGDWNRLAEVFDMDENDNRVQGEVMLKDAARNIVLAYQQGRLVGVLGVADCIVADTADAVLVASRKHAHQIKDLVADMRAHHRQADAHRKVFRPWGYYESLAKDENFQVKRIMIKPGHGLSLQKHRHRSEHWVVVKGKVQVTRGDEVFTLAANQSTYIPAQVQHRLENISREAVRLIEVQCGDYLEEDDIIRLDDRYGRTTPK